MENSITIEELLHEKARELMSKLDNKYSRETCLSLDEYYLNFQNELLEQEKQEIKELLLKF
jgi:hypothetical protein